MAEFLIAGNVESVSFTHGERLCDILRQALPACSVKKMVSLRKNWDQAKRELAKTYGFEEERLRDLECVVWFADGRLLGGADEFSDYCKQTYNIVSDLDLTDLPGIAKENSVVVQKMMASTKEGKVLLDVEAFDGILY